VALRGKRVAVLQPEAYGGSKDVNEAWAVGVLAVGAGPALGESPAVLAVPEHFQELWQERAAIMAYEGRLPCPEAERLAWASLQAAAGHAGSTRSRDTV
jgi:hypothetical protein